MGADWYEPFIIYGCEFVIPPAANFRKFVNKVYELQDFVISPFEIRGVLPSFHSRMECDIDDNRELDELASVVIGFEPPSDVNKLSDLRDRLLMFIKDNVIFEGFDIVHSPKFYCGIEWHPEADDDDESEEPDDDDDDNEDEDTEDDTNSDEDEDDEDESEENNDAQDIKKENTTIPKSINKIY